MNQDVIDAAAQSRCGICETETPAALKPFVANCYRIRVRCAVPQEILDDHCAR